MNYSFLPVFGIIRSIEPMLNCCNLMVSILTQNGVVNMIVTPETYVVNNIRLRTGMQIFAFYDGNAPAPLIFPPQFNAIVIGRAVRGRNVTLDFFDENLENSDHSLRLIPSAQTHISTSNGQMFSCGLENNLLLVYYDVTTRSIPAQTTPREIIVLC